MRSGGGAWKGGPQPGVLRCGSGANDEVTRRTAESHGGEDAMVGGGGDHRGKRSDDAALAGTAGEARVRRADGSEEGKTKPTSRAVEHLRRVVARVLGGLL